jgi:hypothetical protein
MNKKLLSKINFNETQNIAFAIFLRADIEEVTV